MKEVLIKRFGGINKFDNSVELEMQEATDALNVRLVGGGVTKRAGTSTIGGESEEVYDVFSARNKLFRIKKRAADNDKELQVWTGATWASSYTGVIDELVNEIGNIAVFTGHDPSTTIYTGNVVGTPTIQSAVLDQSFTDGQLSGKFIKVGDEVRLITTNAGSTVFVADGFQYANKVSAPAYEIYDEQEINILFGDSEPRYNFDINSTTWSTFPADSEISQHVKFGGIYKNRLVHFSENQVYFSTLLNPFDSPYNIDVNPEDGENNPITAVVPFNDLLVIFKRRKIVLLDIDLSPTDARIIAKSESYGCVAPRSIAVGENILFFISHRGLEWFNPLETETLEANKALSEFRLPEIAEIADKTDMAGVVHDSKYYVTKDNKTYIFDIKNYLQKSNQYRREYTFLIDSGYEANGWTECEEILYSATSNSVIQHNTGTTDYIDDETNNNISSYWKGKKDSIQTINRRKALRRVDTIFSKASSSPATLELSIITDEGTTALADSNASLDFDQIKGKRTKGKYLQFLLTLDNAKDAIVEQLGYTVEFGFKI